MLLKDARSSRIRQLQFHLTQEKIGAAVLSYSRDVFYYAGTSQPSHLVVLPDDYFLFVRSGLSFAMDEAFLEKNRIVEERKLTKIYSMMSSRIPYPSIGTEMDILPANRVMELQDVFSGFQFKDISPLVLKQRSIKDGSEIGYVPGDKSTRRVDR